jgi:hypothetical protein
MPGYVRGQGEINYIAKQDQNGGLMPKPVLLLDVIDLARLIRETYGKPHDLLREIIDDRGGQDSCEIVEIPDWDNGEWDGQENLDPPVPRFDEWVNTPLDEEPERRTPEFYRWEERWEKWTPQRQAIFNDLYEKGLLPAGTYVLHVWW